jgi:LPS O-antigen subunit length determinant protein (WzzB/FepE family)
VQQISSQELIDRVQRNSNETTEQLQDAIQDLEDRFSEYEDYAILSIESEIAGTTVQRISFAVQDNGNWYYWPEE